MTQRHLLAPLAALVATSLLAACGGGSATTTLPTSVTPTASSPSGGSTAAQGQTRVVLKINRSSHAKIAHVKRAHVAKRPAYISGNAKGLQVAVSTTGAPTQTVYIDISTRSPLCTTPALANVETCTFSLPTLGASETITATEINTSPTNEGSNGLGTGFPVASDVLAATVQNVTTIVGGVTNLSLGLDPVAEAFYECTASYFSNSANAGSDTTIGPQASEQRFVVTGGTPVNATIAPQFGDASGAWYNYDASTGNPPLQYADVNGSPTPITLTSSSSHVLLAALANNATPPPSSSFTQSVSIPNDGYEWNNCVLEVALSTDSGFTTGTSVVLQNNLTATTPFTGIPSYGLTITYDIAPITVSPMTATVSADGTTTTATVTGYDYKAASIGAISAFAGSAGACNSSAGTTLATVASSNSLNTTTWQQTFTITGANAGPGTCTFSLSDGSTSVVSQPVTVTVQ